MSRIRVPLFGQILLWLGMNLVLLAGVLFLLVGGGLSWDAIVRGPLGDRPQALAGAIAAELDQSEPSSWSVILERYQEDESVQFSLFRPDGFQIAGAPTTLPAEVGKRLMGLVATGAQGRGQGRGDQRGRPPRPDDQPPRPDEQLRDRSPPPMDGRGPRPGGGPRVGPGVGPGGGPGGGPPPLAPPGDRLFAMRAEGPTPYWFCIRIPVPVGALDPAMRHPAILVAHSDAWYEFAVFTGLARWVPIGGALAVLSGLLWWPLVRSITRSVRRLTDATESIALGKLDTRVSVTGGDELARLGIAVNRMAERLEHFVENERRFMGDIAHELTSPIARAQMALGLLERKLERVAADAPGQSATAPLVENLSDIREEVEQMGALVGELLTFSKAAIAPKAMNLGDVDVGDLVRRAVERERAEGMVEMSVPVGLLVRTDAELLARAVSNVIRNAIRYAAHAGPIEVSATQAGEHVLLTVADVGPGVPPEALARLGEPFFRPESARTRESGGAGLGLSIVRTCLAAVGASVAFANRTPTGFQATLRLPLVRARGEHA